MREKTEEIIQFADLGEFIDYPVKAYSAGMAVRLAFSVSTCINGDVLLLDEILGAGDAQFQKKAANRIYELMDSARLMVLVTHDLETMKKVCNRTLLMDHGRIIYDGRPEDAIKKYMEM